MLTHQIPQQIKLLPPSPSKRHVHPHPKPRPTSQISRPNQQRPTNRIILQQAMPMGSSNGPSQHTLQSTRLGHDQRRQASPTTTHHPMTDLITSRSSTKGNTSRIAQSL